MAARILYRKDAPACACGCKRLVPWRPDRGFGKYASRECYYVRRPKHAPSRTREMRAARNRVRKYGVTLEEALEPHRCEICGVMELVGVDHDHRTGAIRGWLCRRCNTGLGMFQDDPKLIRQALGYLEVVHG